MMIRRQVLCFPTLSPEKPAKGWGTESYGPRSIPVDVVLHSNSDGRAAPGVEREPVGELGHFAANAVEGCVVVALV